MTKIEWAHQTLNPIAGCTQISPECANCYAINMARRLGAMGQEKYGGLVQGGTWTGRTSYDPTVMDKAKTWHKPSRIFLVSMGDLFHESVSDLARAEIIRKAAHYGQHSWLVLTKRPQTMAAFLGERCPKRLPNAWFGCSAGTQGTADRSRAAMADLAMLGFATWVSCEPMLGPVDFSGWEFIRWIVIGGESGPGARPFHAEWAIPVMEWAKANGIAIFFKQMGKANFLGGNPLDHTSKGDDFESWPEAFWVRQFPRGMVQ